MSINLCRNLGISALLLNLFAIWSYNRNLQFIAKPLASIAFVTASFTIPLGDTAYEYRMRIAFILSFIGDVLLLFKDEKIFLIGLWSFALGHVFFAGAFLNQGWKVSLWAITFLVGLIPAWIVRKWLGDYLEPFMRIPVDIYIILITGMVSSAIASAPYCVTPSTQVIGAFLFYFSDLTVARDTFVQPHPINAIIGLPLYYGAQWFFIETLGPA